MEDYKSKLIRQYLKEKIDIAKNIDIESINVLCEKIIKCYDEDGTVFLSANGGPVGAIESFATDLRIHPFVLEDKSITTNIPRLKVISLVESSSMLSGISNDLGYEMVFVEQLKNFLRQGKNINDVYISFSGSGNSKNIINSIEMAKTYGVFCSCISGRDGGKAKKIANNCIIVPGSSKFPGQTGKNDNNFHIEDFQTSITHMITGILKDHVLKKLS